MNPTAEQAWREAELIRSDRKTLQIEITLAGKLVVRLPKHCGKGEVYDFVCRKEAWLTKQLAKVKEQNGLQEGIA